MEGQLFEIEVLHKPYVDPKTKTTFDLITKIKTKKATKRNPIDVSGSMAGSPLKNAKHAIHYILDHLGDKDLLHLVTYESKSEVIFKNKVKSDVNELKVLVDSIKDKGCTNMMAGVDLAKEILKKSKMKDRNILLFTDGMVNEGVKEKPEIYKIIETLRLEYEIITHSFGLGTNYDEELMKQISYKSNGIYYYIEDALSIEKKFSNAFNILCSILYRKVKLNFVPINGTEVKKIYDYESKKIVNIGSLFADDTRNYMLEITVNPNSKEKEYNFLKIVFEAENSETSEETKCEKDCSIKLSTEEDELKVECEEVIDRKIIMDVIKAEKELIQILRRWKDKPIYDESDRYKDRLRDLERRYQRDLKNTKLDSTPKDKVDVEPKPKGFKGFLSKTKKLFKKKEPSNPKTEIAIIEEEYERKKKEITEKIKSGESLKDEREKEKDQAMTSISKCLEKLKPIKDKYVEAGFIYNQLMKDMDNIKNHKIEVVMKSCSYTCSYSYQTTKSYV